MKNSKKTFELEIIIPAYNASKTIKGTLDSIKMQKVSFSFEVLIVNDCSDYSYNKYFNDYSSINIREIYTDSNVGPGGARQLGIDNSSSKYIIFIDSDDRFYDENSLEIMHNNIVNDRCDLLIANFIVDGRNIIKSNDLVWLHGKMYNRDFLDKYNIRFNNSRANEDNGFNRLILLLNPKIKFLNEVVYIYVENSESITRSNSNEYLFTGLEGFCYNMNWAIDEALTREASKSIIGGLCLDLMTSLFFYYNILNEKYDVNKIILWSFKIKNKYNEYKSFVVEDTIENHIEEKLIDWKNIYGEIKLDITFDDFLKLYDAE